MIVTGDFSLADVSAAVRQQRVVKMIFHWIIDECIAKNNEWVAEIQKKTKESHFIFLTVFFR